MTHAYWLMLACNDARNGVHTGTVDAIQVLYRINEEPRMAFAGASWRCALTCDDAGNGYKGFLRLGKLRLPWINSKTWVGNWCWDAVQVPSHAVGKLLTALQESPRWDIDEGESLLFHVFRGHRCLPEDWERWLREAQP